MISMLEFQFSGVGLLEAISAAGILFLALVLIRRLLRVLLARGVYRVAFHRAFPVVESLVWILFAVWAAGLVFVDPLSQTVAVLTLIAVGVFWLSWFAAKDFIAGLILRLQDDYAVGQEIHLNDVEGRILTVGYLGMDIEQASSEVMRIPYSKLTGVVHSRRPPASSNHHQFRVEIPKRVSLEETLRRVRESALTSPWASLTKEPQIRPIAETDEEFILEVAVYGIGPERSEAIERDVRSHLGI